MAALVEVPVLIPDDGEQEILDPGEPAPAVGDIVMPPESAAPETEAPAADITRARTPPVVVDPTHASPRKPAVVMRSSSMLSIKYKYIVLPGNNSIVVREQLEKRPWWEPTADHDTLFNLKWKQTVANVRWDLMNNDPRVKQAVNHLEFNRVICTKSGLAKTLRTYADKMNIDSSTMTPLTFVVEHLRDSEWQAFTSYVRQKLAKGGEDPPNPQAVQLQLAAQQRAIPPRAASPPRRQRSRSPQRKPTAGKGGLAGVAAAAAAAAAAGVPSDARPATPSADEAAALVKPPAPMSAASVLAAQQQRARAAARSNAQATAAAAAAKRSPAATGEKAVEKAVEKAGEKAVEKGGEKAAPAAAQPRARSARRQRRRPSVRARSAPASAREAGEEGEDGSPAPPAAPAAAGLDSIAERKKPEAEGADRRRPPAGGLPSSGSILRPAGQLGGGFNNANIGLWIVKPSHLNRGNGIELFTTVEEIEAHVARNPGVWIVQRYIERPLLIHGRKFDFRIYALITGTLELYVYKEGYIRTSSAAYNLENTVDKYIHLTNNAVQKKGAEYGAFEEGNQLSFDDFQKYLDENHADARIDFRKDLFARMLQHIHTSFMAARKLLNLSGRKHCFEVFGYDFMLDQDFNVLLIEVNTNPCLELSSALLRSIIPQMLDDAMRLTLDVTFPPPRGAKRTVPAPENRFLPLHRNSDPLPAPLATK